MPRTVSNPGPKSQGFCGRRGFQDAQATQYGLRLQRKLPPLAPAILKLIDGRRSLTDIHAALAAQRSDMRRDRFLREFGMLYRALNGIGRMHLSYPPSAVDDGRG